MSDLSDRPWRKRLPGISRLGLVVLLVGLTAFGYGLVQRGLLSSSADSTSAQLSELVAQLERQMDTQPDPAAREGLRRRIDDLAFAAENSLMESRQLEAQHARIAIFGGVASLAGIVILIVHRRRTRNLI